MSQLHINAVHKSANPKINPKVKVQNAMLEKEEVKTLTSIVEQNCNNIQELKKDQQAIRDQMSAMTQTIQNIGGEIRQIKVSIENLQYERIDCPVNWPVTSSNALKEVLIWIMSKMINSRIFISKVNLKDYH